MGWKICHSDSRGKNILIFTQTKLKGVFIIEPEKNEDIRGFFARVYDEKEFLKHKLETKFIQNSISINKKKGTIRGMHYQLHPFDEVKIVRCTKGRIFDVIIDLRKNSSTYKNWFSIELTDENYKMLYIPSEFAHGFQTLENNSEVFYQISKEYNPKFSRGIRWNDPNFRINWPINKIIISEKDEKYLDYA